jgi:cholesterol oxidase
VQHTLNRRRLLANIAGLTAVVAIKPLLGPATARADNLNLLDSDHGTGTTVLIVGSGYAGSIATLRLAQAGIDSIVLERGLRWPITRQGTTFATTSAPDGRAAWLSTTSPFTTQTVPIYTGVLEAYKANGITALAGAGVGGGSLVNSAVMLQPSSTLFEQSFGNTLSYREMDSIWYPRARRLIGVSPMPDDVFNSSYYTAARSFYNEIVAAGFPPVKYDLAIDWDAVRGEMASTLVRSLIINEGIWGVNSGAKRSVDRTILANAEATGLVSVHALSRVTDIVPRDDGYRVSYDQIDTQGNVLASKVIGTRHLVLAAGSLGTTKLLVRAKARGTLPNLDSSVGTRWGNNGDNNSVRTGMAYNNPTQGGPSGIGVEDWTGNPYAPVTLLNFPWRKPPADGSGAIGALGLSPVPGLGTFAYDSATDTVNLTWPDSDPRVTQATQAVSATLSKLNAAHPPSSTSFVSAALTSHTCGGVPIGAAATPEGKVNGYRNLYVIDSALLPSSTGAAPPALTVAAVADRCATRLARSIASSTSTSTPSVSVAR